MQTWKTLAKKTIFDHSKYLVVENHTVALPDGRILDDWAWIITPNYINVVPVTQDGKFYCFRQVKYSVAGTSLAPVGGYIEPGEDPLVAAQRELHEEMGLASQDWIPLGEYGVDGNRGIATCYLYLARDVYRTTEPHADDLEEQEILTLTRSEIRSALKAGEFKVLAWAAVVSLALLYLDEEN